MALLLKGVTLMNLLCLFSLLGLNVSISTLVFVPLLDALAYGYQSQDPLGLHVHLTQHGGRMMGRMLTSIHIFCMPFPSVNVLQKTCGLAHRALMWKSQTFKNVAGRCGYVLTTKFCNTKVLSSHLCLLNHLVFTCCNYVSLERSDWRISCVWFADSESRDC